MNALQTWLESLQFFDAQTTLADVQAQLLWFGGGVFSAFVLGAFSMIIRALRGTVSDVQL